MPACSSSSSGTWSRRATLSHSRMRWNDCTKGALASTNASQINSTVTGPLGSGRPVEDGTHLRTRLGAFLAEHLRGADSARAPALGCRSGSDYLVSTRVTYGIDAFWSASIEPRVLSPSAGGIPGEPLSSFL